MLTFNASAFLYKFRNQQFINVVGIGAQQLVNAGRSEIKGLEIEAALRPAEGLSFTAGLGLLDSEYKELLLNGVDLRSEEHTSELQSLMRISYAVFCLKKKKKTNTYNTIPHLLHNTNND